MDLVYFATHWLYTAFRVRTFESQLGVFRHLISGEPDSVLTRAARKALAVYADSLAIDRRFIPMLLALTWIERATDRVHRRRDDVAPAPDPVLAQYCRYIDLLGEHSESFFRGFDIG